MMDAADFVAKVLQRFPPFHWEDKREQSWMDDATQELAVFESAVLERAMRDLIRARKKPGTPQIAELIAACVEAKRWLKAEKDREQLPLSDQVAQTPEWSKERVKLAYDLCKTDLGRRAAKEGWAYRLWTYCRVERKHPAPALCNQFQRDAAEHQKLVEACARGEGGHYSEHLAKLGQSMLDRERKKAAEIVSSK